MDRRQYIALVGGVSTSLLAGCSDIVSDQDSSSKIRESSSDRVEFVAHRLSTIGTTPFPGDQEAPSENESDTETRTADISGAVSGRVRNVSDSTIAVLRLDAWFYSADGTELGQANLRLEDLAPDEDRNFIISILDRETTADVDDYEIAAVVEE